MSSSKTTTGESPTTSTASERWKKTSKTSYPPHDDLWRGVVRHHAILFVVGLLSFFAYLAWATRKPPEFVELHNVWVSERVDPLDFRAVVQSGSGEWNEFLVNSCPEDRPTDAIQRGITLTLLQYVEDRQRDCKILSGKYAGYIFLRNGNEPTISPDPRTQGDSHATTWRQTARMARTETRTAP